MSHDSMSTEERNAEIQRMASLIQETDEYGLEGFYKEFAEELFSVGFFNFYNNLAPDDKYVYCQLWDENYHHEDIRTIFTSSIDWSMTPDYLFNSASFEMFQHTWSSAFECSEKSLSTEEFQKSVFNFLCHCRETKKDLYYSVLMIAVMKETVGEDRVMRVIDRAAEFKEMREGDIVRLSKSDACFDSMPLAWIASVS